MKERYATAETSQRCLLLCKSLLRFYDFWLSVFLIITSCGALGVKEFMLQFRAPVWKRRRTTYSRTLCVQRGDITPGKVTISSLFQLSSLLLNPTAHLTPVLRWGLQFSDTFSLFVFDLLVSSLIILYYSVLSCIPLPYLLHLFVSP